MIVDTPPPRQDPKQKSRLEARVEVRFITLYLLVSLVALAIDFGLFALMTKSLGIHHLVANPISFTIGSIFAYFGSVRWIFDKRRFDSKSVEFVGFVVIGFGALVVNEFIIWVATDLIGFDPVISKVFAAGGSFIFNYVARRFIIFHK